METGKFDAFPAERIPQQFIDTAVNTIPRERWKCQIGLS